MNIIETLSKKIGLESAREEYENKSIFTYSSKSSSDSQFFGMVSYIGNDIFQFEENDNLNNIFKTYEEKLDSFRKNISLIAFLKFEELPKGEFDINMRNKILQIEEDEFYFPKYVITYTQKGFETLMKTCEGNDFVDKLSEYIKDGTLYVEKKDTDGRNIYEKASDEEIQDQKIKKLTKFDIYAKNPYVDEAYFLAMQLFIKMPFLQFAEDKKEYTTLDHRVSSALTVKNEREYRDEIQTQAGIYKKITDDKKENKSNEGKTLVDKLHEHLDASDIDFLSLSDLIDCIPGTTP